MVVEIPSDMLRYFADLLVHYFKVEPCRWNYEYSVPEGIYIPVSEASRIKPELILDDCVIEEEPNVAGKRCRFTEEWSSSKDYEYTFDCIAIPSTEEYEVVYVLFSPWTKPAGKALRVTVLGEAERWY